MRFFLTIVIATLAANLASAQISLEHTCNTSRYLFIWPNGLSDTYAEADSASDTFYLYSASSHALVRTVTIPTVASHPTILNVTWYRSGIFTSGNEVVAVSVYGGQGSFGEQVYKTIVVDENGNVLLDLNDVSTATPNYTSSGWKLFAQSSIYLFPNPYTSYVYGLPGTASGRVAEAEPNALSLPYPNPSGDRITLPYSVTAPAALEVLDAQGRVVHRAQVGPAFNSYLMDVQGLAPGTYLYRVGTQPPARFVVR
jgi:hypothetical protein